MATITMEQLKKLQQQAAQKWISNQQLAETIKQQWLTIETWTSPKSSWLGAKQPIDANLPPMAKPPQSTQQQTQKKPTTVQSPTTTKPELSSWKPVWLGIDAPIWWASWVSTSKFPKSISQQQYNQFVKNMQNVGKTEADAKAVLEWQWISVDSLWSWIMDFSNMDEKTLASSISSLLDAKENQLTSSLKSEQDAINFITGESNALTNILQQGFEQQRQQLEELKKITGESQANIANIAEQRLLQAKQGAEEVNESLEELRQKSLSLFDENVAQARATRARQLEAEGILTTEQANQAAAYSLSDYVRDVRQQKAEIEQQITQEMTNAIKEKNTLIDSIMQQQAVDENTKQQQAVQITNLYNNLLNNQANALAEVRSKTSDKVLSMFTPTIWREQQIEEWNIQATISEQDRQRANSSSLFRTNYILEQVNSNIDANLAPYIVEYINDLKAMWQFMQWDVTDLMTKLVSQARKQLLADWKA